MVKLLTIAWKRLDTIEWSDTKFGKTASFVKLEFSCKLVNTYPSTANAIQILDFWAYIFSHSMQEISSIILSVSVITIKSVTKWN